MKKIVGIIIATLFWGIQNTSFANPEEVNLNYTETNRLATPISKGTMLENANHMYQNDDIETSYFIPEEDLGDSKIEKAFYKFVNDKVINNKLNMYTMSLGEKH